MVILFGGYLASTEDVLAWQASAAMQEERASFGGYPWPEGLPASAPLERWSRGLAIARLLKRNVATAPHVLIGHSSGCALANDVAEWLLQLKVDDFYLIALDGFRPSDKLLERPQTTCWSATCNGVKSRNYAALEHTPRFHVYMAHNARTEWALHFSLVNEASTDAEVRDISEGYSNCIANLCWWPLITPTAPVA